MYGHSMKHSLCSSLDLAMKTLCVAFRDGDHYVLSICPSLDIEYCVALNERVVVWTWLCKTMCVAFGDGDHYMLSICVLHLMKG